MNEMEKRQTKLVGIRLNEDLFGHLEIDATSRQISPTSRARQIIGEHYGATDDTGSRPSPRKAKRFPVSQSLEQVIEALQNLTFVQADLRSLSAAFRGADLSMAGDELAGFRDSSSAIQRDLSEIKRAILRVAK